MIQREITLIRFYPLFFRFPPDSYIIIGINKQIAPYFSSIHRASVVNILILLIMQAK